MSSILITHALQYAGPGCIDVLLREHGRLCCHDASFGSEDARRQFEAMHPGAVALMAQTPDAIADELLAGAVQIDSVVHNNVYPNVPYDIEAIPATVMQEAFEALLLFPMRLTQRLLPAMREARDGRMVFVTSARYRQPEHGYAVATSIRNATTTFALALARDVAQHGIQVNVVAPNYLYSETYYPRARYVDDPAGREKIRSTVPAGRLGEPREIGELIAFLVSGKSAFTTGQVIDFTGGWP